MDNKVKLLKPIRYGTRIFLKDEIGKIVEEEKPFTFQGEPLYDCFVQFHNHKPIGVLNTEIEILEN